MQPTLESKHFIDLEKAKKLTSKFRKKNKELLAEKLKKKNVLPIYETFDRAAFDALLQQEGCTGVRIYFGMDDNEEVSLVVVGVDENGQDILPAQSSGMDLAVASSQKGIIVDSGQRCPDYCPSSSPLYT